MLTWFLYSHINLLVPFYTYWNCCSNFITSCEIKQIMNNFPYDFSMVISLFKGNQVCRIITVIRKHDPNGWVIDVIDHWIIFYLGPTGILWWRSYHVTSSLGKFTSQHVTHVDKTVTIGIRMSITTCRHTGMCCKVHSFTVSMTCMLYSYGNYTSKTF